MPEKILALAGGVGGAKLALGLAKVLPPGRLVIAVNTGDDEQFHGLHVSPDLDTVMYTLAGISNQETGWGLAGETFGALDMLRRYGADAWFNLGDKDLATHIRRTQMLNEGATLSQVTSDLCRSLGIDHEIVPMSDDPVKTMLDTTAGELPMQDYFVRNRAEPAVSGVRYEGADTASISPGLDRALAAADMVVFCPSNPFLSLGPILAIPGVREHLRNFKGSRVAVSPLVGGEAVKGPAGRIMAGLGEESSSVGVARMYQDICDKLIIDHKDASLAPRIEELGVSAKTESIIMDSLEDKVALARRILEIEGA